MALSPKEIGRRIREVAEEVGVGRAEMADALGVDQNTISKLEMGTLDPIPGDYVLVIARLLKTDFRYFISSDLDDVEAETKKLFRKLAAPTPSDFLAIRRFVSFCMSEKDLEALLSIKRQEDIPTYSTGKASPRLHKDQGRDAAKQERKRLGLGNRPIRNIFEIMRSQGIHLFRHSLEDRNLNGVTIQHPQAGVCVLINYDDDLYRQFFSAAHEYCHVLADRSVLATEGSVVSYRGRYDLVEVRANNFAAEFLLPTGVFDEHKRPKDLNELTSFVRTVAQDYKVNTETVAIKLKDLGWITDKTLASFQAVRPAVIRRSEKTDPDIPLNLTHKQIERRVNAIREGISSYYLELLRRALTEDLITFGRFAEMLDMSTEQARDFVAATRLAI